MAIYDFLPKFRYIEANNLKALQPGFVVAQMPVKASNSIVLADGKHVENGTICSISKDGIDVWSAGKVPFICYNDPLNTVYNSDEFYAVNLDEEYPRLVQLIPGDEFMATYTMSGSSKVYAAGIAALVTAGALVEVTSSDGAGADDWFACDHMANGDKATHFLFLGYDADTVTE